MLFSELLFALLLVCLVAGMAVTAYAVASINRRAEGQGTELAQLRAQLAVGGQVQESVSSEVRERLNQTQALLQGMRAAFVARHQAEDDARQSLRRLEAVIAGSPTRGAAGENILEEAFRQTCSSATSGWVAKWSSSVFSFLAASCCRSTRNGRPALPLRSWLSRTSLRPAALR